MAPRKKPTGPTAVDTGDHAEPVLSTWASQKPPAPQQGQSAAGQSAAGPSQAPAPLPSMRKSQKPPAPQQGESAAVSVEALADGPDVAPPVESPKSKRQTKRRVIVKEEPHVPGPDDVCSMHPNNGHSLTAQLGICRFA